MRLLLAHQSSSSKYDNSCHSAWHPQIPLLKILDSQIPPPSAHQKSQSAWNSLLHP
ncbi:hypothetical protein RchiOBHm_Chr7g0183841 [Rosa chinensis]|uniref:Uncharacterized protein n=1 Tax=Rosa chinensis TaxID=74649 RepID=A0A2P6P385_ROSCH|nr:hypothetical protein RchiOBHm_Chr7g0183841 [Rosa chinensis]